MKEKIIALREQNKSYNEIAQILNVKKDYVYYICRTFGFGGKRAIENPFDCFIRRFNSKFGANFIYLSGYVHSDKPVLIKCKKCGCEFERLANIVRKKNGIRCDGCRVLKAENNNIRERQRRILSNAIRLNKSDNIREINILKCKCCASFFIPSRKRSYCSKKCASRMHSRNKETKRRTLINSNVIDKDISLEKLIQRDNNICYLCNKECDSADYVIDRNNNYIVGPSYPSIDHVIALSNGGSHTWDNIKLAHCYCNSLKSNKDIFV